jgi:hypothetical protein
MSGVLFIGEAELQAIARAIAAAKAKPMPWAVMQEIVVDDRDHPTDTLTLEERERPERLAEIKREYPSQFVQLGSYSAAISFEEQPIGMMRHLSVASRDPGKAPNEHVVKMVAEVFGLSGWPPSRPYRVWIEEFEPGHVAINLAELEPALT